MTADLALRTELMRRQRADGLTDLAFCRRLGVGRSQWTHIRHGRRRLTPRRIQLIRTTCPDLEALCLAALLELGTEHAA